MSVCRRMARNVPRSGSRCAGTTVCANGLSRLIMIWLPCWRRTRKPNRSSAATTCCPEIRGNLLILPAAALPACPLARAGRLPAAGFTPLRRKVESAVVGARSGYRLACCLGAASALLASCPGDAWKELRWSYDGASKGLRRDSREISAPLRSRDRLGDAQPPSLRRLLFDA